MKIGSLWGEVEVQRYRYRCGCGHQGQGYRDESLDESGYLPECLRRIHGTTLRMSYREAEAWLGEWGVKVGKSSLQVLGIRLEQHEQGLSREGLTQLAQQPLKGREGERGRRWCVEVDGCLVATQVEGGIEWREVKSAVVYPMRCPSQRYYVSALTTATAFAPQVHGLLRHAGLRQSDTLIGLSDGAAWIAELFGELGVHRHILDVYHASTYLDTLMTGLGYSDAHRQEQRQALLRGEISIQRWLNLNLREQPINPEAHKALHFLQKQAHLDHTDYPRFKREGIEVIGSGQIEGANKHVIGQRLKITGAHWSESGASAKALVRSRFFSHSPVIPFHTVRHAAFPPAA